MSDNNKLIKEIMTNSAILEFIKEGSLETPEQDWTVIDIHSCVYKIIKIDLDINDTDLFNKLIVLFNAQQLKFNLGIKI